MTTIHKALGATLLLCSTTLQAQELDQAEVRLSYHEFKKLISQQPAEKKAPTPAPELLSAKISLSIDNNQPKLTGQFQTVSFSDEIATAPLLLGDVSVSSKQPESALVVMKNDALSLSTQTAGIHEIDLEILPKIAQQTISFSLPPCPSAIFSVASLPEGQSVIFESNGETQTLLEGQSIPITHYDQFVTVRFLDSKETSKIQKEAIKAQLPPEPSTWTWQHQALVLPQDGELYYYLIATASASDGSGVSATLPMPPDARSIEIEGEDLTSHEKTRGENRALSLTLNWKTRGILDRKVMISYRMPLRPLDPSWNLQVPGDENTRTRFILPQNPLLDYTAEGLTPPTSSQGLPVSIKTVLAGEKCHYLESGVSAKIEVVTIPVATIAKGTVDQATWHTRIEHDGAMLVKGHLLIHHQDSMNFEFDTPEGLKILSCELNGTTIAPVDLSEGRLMVSLPANRKESILTCSFSGTQEALNLVEGTMNTSLPLTPTFIHALDWSIDLPAGYQAETHGNLKRHNPTENSSPSRIQLKKNLCRDERPAVQVFYQRNDLKL